MIAIKIRDHLKLAELQLSEQIKQKEQIRLSRGYADLTLRKEKIKINKKLSEGLDKVNTQLISILGIFTAIAFVLFGGISALGGIKDVVKANGLDFLRILSYVAIVGSFVIGALLLFFKFILTLTKPPKLGEETIEFGKIVFWSLVKLAIALIVLSFLVELGFIAWLFDKLKSIVLCLFSLIKSRKKS